MALDRGVPKSEPAPSKGPAVLIFQGHHDGPWEKCGHYLRLSLPYLQVAPVLLRGVISSGGRVYRVQGPGFRIED